MVLILELPGYCLGPKDNNKLPPISPWGETGLKNKVKTGQGNHRKKQSDTVI